MLVLFEGSSVRTAGEEMQPGFERDVVLAVGKPAGWVADRLPFDEWGDDALAFLEDEGLGDEGGFDSSAGARHAAACRRCTPDSFDPAELGAKPEPPRPLDTLLVTGDSLAMPLDVRDWRAGWPRRRGRRRAARPARRAPASRRAAWSTGASSRPSRCASDEPDAVVVFIGANEGFPMPGSGRRRGRAAAAPSGRPRTPTACAG